MATPTTAVSLLIILSLAAVSSSEDGVIRMYPKEHLVRTDDDPACESWKFAAEVNAAGNWKMFPNCCLNFVEEYFHSNRYLNDCSAVCGFSQSYAESINVAAGIGKDAWVFDIDETLLSNLAFYELHGYGSEAYNETSFNEWVSSGYAPAIPPSYNLYNKVKMLGFNIFLITGRPESLRNATESNLLYVGYTGWKRLILRQTGDEKKTAAVYKSERRAELIKEGYVIQGSNGDQWSDLEGFALAKRSFKLPNPVYYIA